MDKKQYTKLSVRNIHLKKDIRLLSNAKRNIKRNATIMGDK